MSLIEMFEQLGRQLGQAAVAGFKSEVDGKLTHMRKPKKWKMISEATTTDILKKIRTAQNTCLVPNCTRNVAARKLCGPHYAKAKHFKIDLTQKHIPAKLLKLLAADGRKVDLTLIAGGMPQSKPAQKTKTAKAQKAQKANAKPKTQKQPQPTAQPASAAQTKLAEPMF